MTDELDVECRRIFPAMWDKEYKMIYKRHQKKHRSTHIAWATFPQPQMDNGIINEIENDLIESINPIANVHRSTPPTHLRDDTIEILKQFRYHIHEQRDLLLKTK